MTSKIKLFCIVDGESTAFPVDILQNLTFGDLKEAIKKKKAIEFSEFDADKLTLYLANIHINDEEDEAPIQLQAHPTAKRLQSVSKIAKMLPVIPEDTIHIIVQRPDRTSG